MNIIVNREDAFLKLFALLQTIPGIKTCTRKFKHWHDVPNEEQPAIYLRYAGENRLTTRGLPSSYSLDFRLLLYVGTEGSETGPIMNPLLDAIDNVFKSPVEGEVLTLQGTTHRCWIEGTTEIYEGDLGEEAVAIIPIKLLIT